MQEGVGLNPSTGYFNGTFFTLTCCKNCIVCLKSPIIITKRPGMAQCLSRLQQNLTQFVYLIAA